MSDIKKNMWYGILGNGEGLLAGETVAGPVKEDLEISYGNMEKKIRALDEGATIWGQQKQIDILKTLKEQMGLERDTEHDQFFSQRANEMLVWYPRKASNAGYENDTMNSGILQYFNIKDLLARFFIQAHVDFGPIKNWRHNIIGVTNIDGFEGPPETRMPVFDYDGKNVKTKIRKDVKLLQKTYQLGNAWVYETKRGFHIYFFCDRVPKAEYLTMLESVQCCEGFKRVTNKKGYAVLRVSAKYTDFDIKFLYILSTGNKEKLRRMGQKAYIIQKLLALGEECGTHFASLFPEWAYYKEDQKEWKFIPNHKLWKSKRIRKLGNKKESFEERYRKDFEQKYLTTTMKRNKKPPEEEVEEVMKPIRLKYTYDNCISTTTTDNFTVVWTAENNKDNTNF